MCCGCKGVRASGGDRNKVLAGIGAPPHNTPLSSSPRSRFDAGEEASTDGRSFRLPFSSGEPDAVATPASAASSNCRFTSKAPIVSALTVSKARKPRMSMVSSDRRSSCEGKLR